MGPSPSVESTVELQDPRLQFYCEDCDCTYGYWNLTDALVEAADGYPSVRKGFCSWCSDHDPSPIQYEGLRHPGRFSYESAPYNNCSLKCIECNCCYAKFNEGIGHQKGFREDDTIPWSVGYCADCKGNWSKQRQFNGLSKREIKRKYKEEVDWERAVKCAERCRDDTSDDKVSVYVVYNNTRPFTCFCGGLNRHYDRNYRQFGTYTVAKFEADHRKNGATFTANMDGSLSSIFEDIKNTSSCSYIAFESRGKWRSFNRYKGDGYKTQTKNKKCAISLV
eukprot:103606_1